MTSVPSRVSYDINAKTLHEMVEKLESNELSIPPHQREFCWDLKKQREFMHTVFEGIPTQSIITRRVNRGDDSETLEDGRQRLTTSQRYLNDQFAAEYQGKEVKFSELPLKMQQNVRSYTFGITTYKNATTEQTICIFDRFQNGLPLSVGERLKSMTEICPIIAYANKTFLTSDSPHYEKIEQVFGKRDPKSNKRSQNLTKAFAITAGLAFGSHCITKKWREITERKVEHGGASILTRQFNSRYTTKMLENLLDIYTTADERFPLKGSNHKKAQWDVGKITAYIVHSLTKSDALPYQEIKEKWVDFIVDARRNKELINNVLHSGKKASRNWTIERWEMGVLRLFDPDEAERLQSGLIEQSETESDEESD